MTLDFQQFSEVEHWQDLQSSLDERLNKAINWMIQDHPYVVGWINVIVLASEGHKTLNSRYLGHDYATDVLTFPFNEGDQINGEIYVDAEVVKENAERFEMTLEKEYARMVIHGALHLLGYDDGTDEERAKMRQLEDKYLAVL